MAKRKYKDGNNKEYGEGFACLCIIFFFIFFLTLVGMYENKKYISLPKAIKKEELSILEIKPEHFHFYLKTVDENGQIYTTFSKFCHGFEKYKTLKVNDKIHLSVFKNKMVNVC